MTTLLHVENDASLIELVEDCFAAFGFDGTYMPAMTVAEADHIIDDLRHYPTLDLVLSDMTLPDGTGLDVVRSVRTNIAREHVPIVILSGDTNPAIVNRAYAMGANSFIGKGLRARSIAQTMTALYGHWLRDAKLPTPERVGRTEAFVARAVTVRKRKAQLYMRIAEHMGEEDAEFWMDLALREGNLSNVLAFLRSQLCGRELPVHLLEQAEAMQHREMVLLDHLEGRPVETLDDAQALICATVATYNAELVARVTAELFPVIPVAMPTLCNVAASTLDEIAGWIEKHATNPALRAELPKLYADAARVRAVPASEPRLQRAALHQPRSGS